MFCAHSQCCAIFFYEVVIVFLLYSHRNLVPLFFQEFLQLGAGLVSSDDPFPSVGDLADQIADVLDFFWYVKNCTKCISILDQQVQYVANMHFCEIFLNLFGFTYRC